ncbi:tRNA (adenosine(37)-N6)-threonylcarbamoyltransferase complex ATPase subunit type 1 TsaE [Hippea sp. KM1]|uniref:tRNA (adenosine(37)-N6)-threonylcarbamoyltransferase complex ATPase subunit type 1 TsaE n=1 Tax=Hippea sp. KM1 TaxID=944481 RepID=UPI00046D8BEB|nr:tRNA (adenosine(37)-N6)-threonylcarbamoyltransferase complex ATPase subunit type 1 TsaE [Hippea sp. KM1]
MINKTYLTKSEKETAQIAKQIVDAMIKGKKRVVVFLEGEMGIGKTTFIRFALKALGISEDEFEGSPSFTLINQYKGNIYHMDLYRITEEEELYHAGIYEFFSNEGIFFIEWPEKLNIKPDITIKFKETLNWREIDVCQW